MKNKVANNPTESISSVINTALEYYFKGLEDKHIETALTELRGDLNRMGFYSAITLEMLYTLMNIYLIDNSVGNTSKEIADGGKQAHDIITHIRGILTKKTEGFVDKYHNLGRQEQYKEN